MSDDSENLDDKLIEACEQQDEEQIITLLAAGADPNATKEVELGKRTVLRPAIRVLNYPESFALNAPLECFDPLLDAGADVDAIDPQGSDDTLLRQAAESNDEERVEFFIEKGADTSITCVNGWTAFERICGDSNRHHKAIGVFVRLTDEGKQWLTTEDGKTWSHWEEIDNGAPIPDKRRHVEDRVLWAMHMEPGNLDNFSDKEQLLSWIESGGDINWQTEWGSPLLHLAARRGNDQIIRLLAEKGADIFAVDNLQRTALMVSCWVEYPDLFLNPDAVAVLLELGLYDSMTHQKCRTLPDRSRDRRKEAATKILALFDSHKANGD